MWKKRNSDEQNLLGEFNINYIVVKRKIYKVSLPKRKMGLLNNLELSSIEERLSKFKPRHLRLLNRIATKNIQSKITNKRSLKDVKTALVATVFEDCKKYPYLVGVNSAIYSRIDKSIKHTRFNHANLGLVITNNDVNTRYNLENLTDFMKCSKISNSNLFFSYP